MKLPAAVYSILGPVPVIAAPGLLQRPEPAYGIWRGDAREIDIDTDVPAWRQAATLFHEITHVALTDSGVDCVLTEKQAEAVANALGSYFAAAVQSGYVRLTVPR